MAYSQRPDPPIELGEAAEEYFMIDKMKRTYQRPLVLVPDEDQESSSIYVSASSGTRSNSEDLGEVLLQAEGLADDRNIGETSEGEAMLDEEWEKNCSFLLALNDIWHEEVIPLLKQTEEALHMSTTMLKGIQDTLDFFQESISNKEKDRINPTRFRAMI